MDLRIYSLGNLSKDVPEKISLNQNIEWFKRILDELNEAAGKEEAQMLEEAHLSFAGEIKKSKNVKFGEYVLVTGQIVSKFVTQCIKTGQMMFDQIDCEVEAACLLKSRQQDLGLEEGDSVFLEDRELELFFFEKNQVDLEPVLHEFVFLNKNPYPTATQEDEPSPLH